MPCLAFLDLLNYGARSLYLCRELRRAGLREQLQVWVWHKWSFSGAAWTLPRATLSRGCSARDFPVSHSLLLSCVAG